MKKNHVWKKITGMTLLMFLLTMLMGVTAFAAPGTPAKLKQTSNSTNSVSLTWDAVLGANVRYQVQYSSDQKKWYEAQSYYSNSPTIYKSGLSTGKTYYFRVRSFEYTYGVKPNDANASRWSSVFTAVTAPGNIPSNTLKQSGATTSTISLKWGAAPGANRYRVYRMNGSKATQVAVVSGTSAKISKLKSGQSYNFKVEPERYAGNAVAKAYGYASAYGKKTLPGKPSGLKLGTVYPSIKKAEIRWTRNVNANGYEIALYTYKGKRVGKTKTVKGSYPSYTLTNVKASSFYRVRIRPYVQLDCGKKYGSWSSYLYLGNQPKVTGKKVSGGIRLSWSKVSGAQSYTVYASTKSRSGFKKVATVKSNKYTLKKIGRTKLKKNKTYYTYVIANRKVSGKTYKTGKYYSYSVRYR